MLFEIISKVLSPPENDNFIVVRYCSAHTVYILTSLTGEYQYDMVKMMGEKHIGSVEINQGHRCILQMLAKELRQADKLLYYSYFYSISQCNIKYHTSYPIFLWAGGRCSPPVWFWRSCLHLCGQHSHHPPAGRPGSFCPDCRNPELGFVQSTLQESCPAQGTVILDWHFR